MVHTEELQYLKVDCSIFSAHCVTLMRLCRLFPFKNVISSDYEPKDTSYIIIQPTKRPTVEMGKHK